MQLAFDRPLVCPVLVGREACVEALDRSLEQVRGGQGQIVLIGGEAGIGKSRLAATLRKHAEVEGLGAIEGSCFERDRSLPYAPFVDALRTLVSNLEPAEAFDELGPELATLLPELGVANAFDEAPEQRHRRIFESLLKLVKKHAARNGAVLIVEDLHWSDATSLDVFGMLARRLHSDGVLLVGTYRDDEPSAGLAILRADLERARLSSEMRLVRLDGAQVQSMVRAIFGLTRTARPGFTQRLFELTDGNPFFVEEVLRSIVATAPAGSGQNWDLLPVHELRLPMSVQDAVQRRTQGLTAHARRVVVLAAITGRRFEFSLLQQLSELDESALLEAIKELIEAQLVLEESSETFAFRHALTRQAIHDQILARERHAVHRRVADVLEQTSAEQRLEDLAYHYYEAGNWRKAADYAERAGRRARGLYATAAALEHFSLAVEAITRLGEPIPGRLYRQRALAHEALGAFAQANTDYEASLRVARSNGEPSAECQALLDLGFLWAARDYARTGDYFGQALALARQLDDAATLASALNRVGNWHVNVEQPAEAVAFHREALSIFEALDDRRGVAQTLDLLALATGFGGDLIGAADLYDRAIALHRQLDDRVALCSSLSVRAVAGGGGSTWNVSPASIAAAREALHGAEEALRTARAIGFRAGESFACHAVAEAGFARGFYTRAIEVSRAGLQLAEEIAHEQWACSLHFVLGTLLRELSAMPQANQHLDRSLELARSIGSRFWKRITGAALVELKVEVGDFDAAERLARELLDQSEQPRSIAARQVRFAQARLALAWGDGERAGSMLDALRVDGSTPTLDLLYAQTLLAIGRPDEAERCLHAALALAETSCQRAIAWRLRALLPRVLEAQGRHFEAQRAREAAEASIAEIALEVPDELRACFVEAAMRTMGARPRRGPRDQAGLSPRERSVALLLGEGLSNRAIADRLTLGERTVESHVSAILAKLRMTNRSQVAAWIAREDPHR